MQCVNYIHQLVLQTPWTPTNRQSLGHLLQQRWRKQKRRQTVVGADIRFSLFLLSPNLSEETLRLCVMYVIWTRRTRCRAPASRRASRRCRRVDASNKRTLVPGRSPVARHHSARPLAMTVTSRQNFAVNSQYVYVMWWCVYFKFNIYWAEMFKLPDTNNYLARNWKLSNAKTQNAKNYYSKISFNFKRTIVNLQLAQTTTTATRWSFSRRQAMANRTHRHAFLLLWPWLWLDDLDM